MPSKTRPIEKFATAVGKCSAEGAVYGKCIVADYQNVTKDKCLTEFLKLKDCYLAAYKKR
ncbi:hypothetical protein BU16DRAFT_528507 [Lophium mytilinum]|uniref:IMS import disulfide relay-system CHCH-CHCH-like Cx9C domain-containing protein n=1 Tax=Lophium mytilinum TaxID=390894 RepID=A0A6A6QQQ4_9PEZI|nr:hypothetical protein BU16DRAFT_528507 [Lophium mytilinum]